MAFLCSRICYKVKGVLGATHPDFQDQLVYLYSLVLADSILPLHLFPQ